MLPQQVSTPPLIQPDVPKPVPFWKRKLVWVSILVIIVFAGLISSGSDNSEPTKDVFAADCGAFSLVLHEDLRINRFEGSSENLSLVYKSVEKNEILFEEDSLSFITQDFLIPPPLHTKAPYTLFENLTSEIPQEDAALRTVYVSPERFSRADFDSIGNCLEQNLNNFDAARKDHLKRFDIGHNNFRFVAAAYSDKKELEDFISNFNHGPLFREGRPGDYQGVYVHNTGVVTRNGRYIGNVFDLIPAGNNSPLKYETVKNDNGAPLGSYLETLATNLANYDGQPQ